MEGDRKGRLGDATVCGGIQFTSTLPVDNPEGVHNFERAVTYHIPLFPLPPPPPRFAPFLQQRF